MHADERGTELPDQDGAAGVALEIVSQLVRDAADDLWRGGAFRVLAEDEGRAPVFQVEVRLDRGQGAAGRTSADTQEIHSGGIPL